MIQRLAAALGGGNRHLQVLADPVLADVVVQRPWPEPGLVLDVLVHPSGGHKSLFRSLPSLH